MSLGTSFAGRMRGDMMYHPGFLQDVFAVSAIPRFISRAAPHSFERFVRTTIRPPP